MHDLPQRWTRGRRERKGVKKVGILFGMEDTFPWALINEVNARSGGDVTAEPVQIGAVMDRGPAQYDVIVDRISHDVPFYRTWVKCEAAKGAHIVNNPFWWSADDKFFDNIAAMAAGVAVPKTALLPHKQHPPNTETKSFRNLKFVEWDELFEYLGFPIFMKPAYGGGWRDVYKCDNREEFFAAYDQTRDLTMMAQEAIDFDRYYRCWVVGRRNVRVMQYDPKAPFHERYVRMGTADDDPLVRKVHDQALRLCELLGYDMNTVEFAVRDGIPYAIDFMNCAPDADVHSVGEDNFNWIVQHMADFLVDLARSGRPFELTGDWPAAMGRLDRSAPAKSPNTDAADLRGSAAPAPSPVAAPAPPKKTPAPRTKSATKTVTKPAPKKSGALEDSRPKRARKKEE